MKTFRLAALGAAACFLATALTIPSPASAQEEESDKWDVEGELGPSTQLTFDADEGTWMNLDVSPDGRTVIFDLMGDIYTMPVEGGIATRIVAGSSFDMQPRFSPDGSRVAFISDRAGNWNIWTMDPDGSGQAVL